MVLQIIISGQIFALILTEVEMAISNAILNQTIKLMLSVGDILINIILKN